MFFPYTWTAAPKSVEETFKNINIIIYKLLLVFDILISVMLFKITVQQINIIILQCHVFTLKNREYDVHFTSDLILC